MAAALGWLYASGRDAPAPPLDDIDPASRRELDRLLRDAEAAEEG